MKVSKLEAAESAAVLDLYAMRASPVYEMLQSLAIFYDSISLHLNTRRLDGRREFEFETKTRRRILRVLDY